MRHSVCCYAMSGTGIAYGHMQCPVLGSCMLLRDAGNLVLRPPTDIAYPASGVGVAIGQVAPYPISVPHIA
eukprot:1967159-Rhodomonas_salina.1